MADNLVTSNVVTNRVRVALIGESRWRARGKTRGVFCVVWHRREGSGVGRLLQHSACSSPGHSCRWNTRGAEAKGAMMAFWVYTNRAPGAFCLFDACRSETWLQPAIQCSKPEAVPHTWNENETTR